MRNVAHPLLDGLPKTRPQRIAQPVRAGIPYAHLPAPRSKPACGPRLAASLRHRWASLKPRRKAALLLILLILLLLLWLMRLGEGGSGAVQSTAEVAAAGVSHRTGAVCRRIPLAAKYRVGNVTAYTPSAVRDPVHGWTAVLRLDRCCWRYNCKVWERDSRPLVVTLGRGGELSLEPGAMQQEVWEYDRASYSRQRMWQIANSTRWLDHRNVSGSFRTQAYRPFMYKGSTYVSHELLFRNADYSVSQAISQLNFNTRQLRLVHAFTQPLRGKNQESWYLRDWSFLDYGGDLLVFRSYLPCTEVLAVEAAAPLGLQFRERHCYAPHRVIGIETGLPLGQQLRSSCHPIPRLATAGATAHYHSTGRPGLKELSEYIVLVHSDADRFYSHWALRLDTETLAITHISRGPVISWHHFRKVEGEQEGYMVVGSAHLVWRGGQELLRVFLGENDRHPCVDEIAMDSVAWYRLDQSLTRSDDEWSHPLDRLREPEYGDDQLHVVAAGIVAKGDSGLDQFW